MFTYAIDIRQRLYMRIRVAVSGDHRIQYMRIRVGVSGVAP